MNKNMDDDSDLERFMDRLHNRNFDAETCFLCARRLEPLGPTAEHVIPRWAQKRFDLWDQTIKLLNGTHIPYRYLTVPCCDECNKYRLHPIEDSVLAAVENGAEAVKALGNRVLWLWLGKIIYGLLYRELLLPFDRRDPTKGTIINDSLLREYETHLILLQQARGKLETVDFVPGSIFIFNCQQPQTALKQWDLLDNIDSLFIGVRMGRVGIVGSLCDGGAQSMSSVFPDEVFRMQLHPMQFREVCATVAYRASTATRIPHLLTVEGTPHKTYQLPLMGYSLKPLFETWEPAVYAKFLAAYLGYKYDDVFFPPDKVLTFMVNSDRSFRYFPLDTDEGA
jgi:hypothetical protein